MAHLLGLAALTLSLGIVCGGAWTSGGPVVITEEDRVLIPISQYTKSNLLLAGMQALNRTTKLAEMANLLSGKIKQLETAIKARNTSMNYLSFSDRMQCFYERSLQTECDICSRRECHRYLMDNCPWATRKGEPHTPTNPIQTDGMATSKPSNGLTPNSSVSQDKNLTVAAAFTEESITDFPKPDMGYLQRIDEALTELRHSADILEESIGFINDINLGEETSTLIWDAVLESDRDLLETWFDDVDIWETVKADISSIQSEAAAIDIWMPNDLDYPISVPDISLPDAIELEVKASEIIDSIGKQLPDFNIWKRDVSRSEEHESFPAESQIEEMTKAEHESSPAVSQIVGTTTEKHESSPAVSQIDGTTTEKHESSPAVSQIDGNTTEKHESSPAVSQIDGTTTDKHESSPAVSQIDETTCVHEYEQHPKSYCARVAADKCAEPCRRDQICSKIKLALTKETRHLEEVKNLTNKLHLELSAVRWANGLKMALEQKKNQAEKSPFLKIGKLEFLPEEFNTETPWMFDNVRAWISVLSVFNETDQLPSLRMIELNNGTGVLLQLPFNPYHSHTPGRQHPVVGAIIEHFNKRVYAKDRQQLILEKTAME